MKAATVISYLSLAVLPVAQCQTKPDNQTFPGEMGPFDLKLFGQTDFVGAYVIPRDRADRRFAGTNMTWETSPLPFTRPRFYWEPSTALLRVRGRDPKGSYEMTAAYVPGTNNGDLWPLKFSNRRLGGFNEMTGWNFNVTTSTTTTSTSTATSTVTSSTSSTSTSTGTTSTTASTTSTTPTPTPSVLADIVGRKLTLWNDDNFWVCQEKDPRGNDVAGIYHSMRKDIDSKGCLAITLKVAV